MKLVICTCKSNQTKEITECLLEKRLIAGVNVIPGIHSKYWWKGKIEEDREDFLIMESRKELIPELITTIKEIHSYETPKVISFNIEEGFNDYLSWVMKETSGRDFKRSDISDTTV